MKYLTSQSSVQRTSCGNGFVRIQLSVIEKIRRWGMYLVLCLIPVGGGCADIAVENAFRGDYTTAKSNRIINEYCQSCHIHKDFEPGPHMAEMRANYKRPFFRKAQGCRSCHYIEKNWVHNQFMRKTRMPNDANRGEYRDFEKKELKKKKTG